MNAGAGSSNVFPGRDQLRTLFNESVRSRGAFVGDVAGDGEDIAILLEREARRDARTGIFSGFYDQHADRHSAEDAVADGKILGSGKAAEGKFGDQSAAQSENLLG